MYRAFLSLYLLIALSLLVTGWGLDKVWQLYSPEAGVSLQDEDLVRLVETRLLSAPDGSGLAWLNEQMHFRTELIPLEDFAQSRLLEDLRRGDPAVVNDAGGNKFIYRRLGAGTQVIKLEQKSARSPRPRLYDALVVVFYVAMAVAVLFWVWPLSRDLAKLEKQTGLIGRQGVPGDLHVRGTSPVRNLAAAFNGMARRIRDLLLSHQEMTCAVSHELRTPLARMKFGLELASEAENLPMVRRQLAGVRQDVSEMDALINQLLTYVGYEQNEKSLDLQAGDMGYLIERCTRQLDLHGAGFDLEFHNLHPGPVVCEWHLMERAVVNVLQNASRFARNRIRITLSVCEGDYLCCVEDDGPGIPVADRERVFQSFVRLTQEGQPPNSGFGLGLAIVRRILNWHKGTAIVGESTLGGARFELRWPQVC